MYDYEKVFFFFLEMTIWDCHSGAISFITLQGAVYRAYVHILP